MAAEALWRLDAAIRSLDPPGRPDEPPDCFAENGRRRMIMGFLHVGGEDATR
jgi:hypothetical protein